MAQYALILAGGSGTRFWPLSRNSRPKQLLNLFDGETLLEQTISRLEGLIPPENILILTSSLQESEVRRLATKLPPENIYAEPAKRDTAPAVALGVGLIAARDPEASMIILPSDQLIQNVDAFQSVVRDTLEIAAHNSALVTIGIRPSWACPSYGYIERGEAVSFPELELGHEVREVQRFREKPAPSLAETFLREGNFAWNAGIFVWSVQTVLAELWDHAPEFARFIENVQNSPDLQATVEADFPRLPTISIDYALMEKASRVLNIEATFDWDDVGSWISVAQYLPTQGDNNQTNLPITEIDSENNVIFNARDHSHIALLGVDDLIVVQTEDALLIANRHQADDIKKLGVKLPQSLL